MTHPYADLATHVTVRWNVAGPSGGGVIEGAPHVLKTICARLGFKNECKRGSVYLTGPKMERIGLGTGVREDEQKGQP